MCYQVKAGRTDLWRAQQVLLRMYAYGKLERLEPAVVMDAAAATHEPQLLVKVISTGEHRCVPRSHIEAYSPAPAFKPGQTVYRAMWSGEEEKAKVVCVDSATHVTIRLAGSGVTYSSDAFRLRHKTPPAESALAPAEEGYMATSGIENLFIKLMSGSLLPGCSVSALFAQRTKELLGLLYADAAEQQFGDVLCDIQVNTALSETLAARFMAAWDAAKDTHDIHLLLHGSPEENVDSILKHGVRGRAGCNTRWLTSCPNTAVGYACDAQRIIVCATLLPKQATANGSYIFTINRDEHHVPLFVAQFDA